MAIRRNQYQPSTYLNFDGVSGSYVQLAVSNVVPNGTTAFSASAWVYLKPFGSGSSDHIGSIIGNRQDSVTAGWVFKVSNKAQQKAEFTFYDQNTSSQGDISTVTIPSYRWCHLVVTFDGRTTTFYIDGNVNLRTTLGVAKTMTENTGQNIRIGHRQAAGSTFETFAGSMSQLAIYNRVLTATEVATIYNTRTLPQNSLLSYWAMNEGTGSTITDSIAAKNGTLTGGVTWGSTALNTARPVAPTTVNFSNSLSLNGTSDLITVPDNNAYSYATNSALSISVWINPATLTQPTPEGTGYVHFLSKLDSSQNEWTFRMYSTGNSESRNNRISFYAFALAGGLGDGAYIEDEVIPGKWIHLVATIDASKNIRLYKNGVLRNVFLASALTLANGTAPVRIGGGASGQSLFNGQIQGVEIFNTVLSDTQIKEKFDKNLSIATGLVGKFKIDEGSGTTITDTSSTANNGTLSGGTWITGGWLRKRQDVYSKKPTNLNTVDTTTNITATRRRVNNGASLVLASASSQYATIVNASQHGLDIGTSDFMVGGWFKIKISNAIQVLLAKYSGTGFVTTNTTNVGFDLLYRADQASRPLQLRINDGTTNITCALNNSSSVLTAGWNHIAIYVSRAGLATFVINGVAVANPSAVGPALTLTNTGPLVIGTRTDATTGFTNGSFQNIFHYVFPSGIPTNIRKVINDIYKKNVYSSSGLVALWSFDNVATDSVNGNTLTLNGSPSYSSTDVPIKARTLTT